MAKLYGKGTIKEIVKGKKYYISLSAGKDPLSDRVLAPREKKLDDAFAIDENGKAVKPKITWGKATDEQKATYSRWKSPKKYLRHQETFLGTKRQAELRVEAIRQELESGKRPDSDKMTLGEWSELYLSTREKLGNLRPSTLKRYRSVCRHIVRNLGAIRLVDLTPKMIEGMYASMLDNGVGPSSVLQTHKLLKLILKDAMRNSIIVRNPVDLVDTPKRPKPKRESLERSEAARLGELCSCGTPSANKTAVYLGLALGARLGEVLGLQWQHIVLDGERPFACIIQQYTSRRELTPLKTDDDSNPIGRKVPLDASTIALLRSWKAVQRAELNELGIEQGADTPVVTNHLGRFTDHYNFESWFRSFCASNGYGRFLDENDRTIVELPVGFDTTLYPESEYCIQWRDPEGWPCDADGKRYSRSYKRPKVRRHYNGLVFHELRHTHFTLRIDDGMDVPTAQALGGWTTPQVLMSVYVHSVPESVWASVGFMDRLTTGQTV